MELRLSDISEQVFMGGGAKGEWLVRTLVRALDEEPGFTHFAPITGERFSARILTTFEFPEGAALPAIMPARDMANELVRLTPDARYEPETLEGAEKGWLIFSAMFRGMPVTFVRTMYCLGAV